MGRSIAIAVFAAALALAGPLAAHAAGLGKLTVLSPLGQPLLAEIEIVSPQPGEEEGLSARLAAPEAFNQAGIEYGSALMGMRFEVLRRDGRQILRVTTAQPLNEPFVDMLVELQWNTGRLIREYTFLLDPPEFKGPPVVAATPPAQAPSAPSTETQPRAQQPIESKPLATQPPAPSAAATAEQYEVKPGDTLARIARRHMAPGVSLDQMLIAIYRANEDAFIRNNVNLVRAGKILSIPADATATVDPEEATRLMRSHYAEFNTYRSRMAAAPAAADSTPGTQEVTGRIESKPAVPAPQDPQDQLRLSKADPAKPAAAGSRAAQEDDRIARERALQEAQSRQAELEKNVADLQKLLELKNQQLAELEKKAAASAAAVAPAPKAGEQPKPAAPKPAASVEAPKPAAEAPKPAAEAPKPAAEAATPPAEAPKPAAEAPKAKPKPTAAAPKKSAPPPEPSLLDEFSDNPVALGGLVLVILLLAGYGAWAWRRKKASHAKFQDSVLDAASGAGAPSVFGSVASGGLADASQSSVSQAPAGMEAEEVDPIAEADVYMAYGRDAQAEEILKEAVSKDGSRTAVHAKLLEIYANRKDAKSYEQTAVKLKSLTHGAGPDWEKAAALGRTLDPQNGLYGGAAIAATPAAAAAAAPALDFDLGGTPSQQEAAAAPDIALDASPDETASSSIDFDLGATTVAPEEEKSDFTPEGTLIMGKEADSTASGGLDFDLGLGGETKTEVSAAPEPAAADAGGLDFDLDLDIGGIGTDAGTDKASQSASMDLSDISLDLGDSGASASGGDADPKWQEVATKLDLAKAYEEMGDKDGAKELLSEVMKDGDGSQKDQAQQLLAKLG